MSFTKIRVFNGVLGETSAPPVSCILSFREGGFKMPSEAQKEAAKRYKKKVRKFELNLSPVDQDMIDFLESKKKKDGGVQGYLKEIIRRDM